MQKMELLDHHRDPRTIVLRAAHKIAAAGAHCWVERRPNLRSGLRAGSARVVASSGPLASPQARAAAQQLGVGSSGLRPHASSA